MLKGTKKIASWPKKNTSMYLQNKCPFLQKINLLKILLGNLKNYQKNAMLMHQEAFYATQEIKSSFNFNSNSTPSESELKRMDNNYELYLWNKKNKL